MHADVTGHLNAQVWSGHQLCSIFRYLWQRALQCLCGVSALARLWLADLLSCHSQAW